MQSAYLKYFIADIAAAFGEEGRHVLSQSVCLSADVNVALDPIFPDVVEARNCAKLNGGVVLTKYTGSRGKSDTSDASAELMGRIRSLMEEADVVWQIGELGRVDAGGAARWPNISRIWMWIPWTWGFRCCPCTPPSRWWPSWTFIWRIRPLPRC